MHAKLSDLEIMSYAREMKRLPPPGVPFLRLKRKQGHREGEIALVGDSGASYRLLLRQNVHNLANFSALLLYLWPNSTERFCLRRYNGDWHSHKNKVVREVIRGFHVHIATERYQQIGLREDDYAEPSSEYHDLHSALACLCRDCNVVPPLLVELFTRQPSLFPEEDE